MLIRSLFASAFIAAGSLHAMLPQAERQPHEHGAAGQAPPAQPAKPVNDRCPIRGEEVDPETPTRVWRGQTIGFCCPGCDKKWDAKPDADKDAFLARFVDNAPASPALLLARRLHTAMAEGDIAGMNAMFLADGRATVLENGGDEGTWEAYREGRLKAQLGQHKGSAWTTQSEHEARHGDAWVVRRVGTIDAGAGSASGTLSVAVTLIVVDDAGTPRIAHMHRSFRRIDAPAR